MREAIAESLWSHVKDYDLAEFCERLGLAAQREGEEPGRSKRGYVKARLNLLGLHELVPIARALLAEWDDEDLQDLVDRAGALGVAGELKNLIFASNGSKPKIVLRDALANTLEITENGHTCLIYDRPLPEEGLTWGALVRWWATEKLHETNLHVAGHHLYMRLLDSLDEGPERMVLWTYARRYGLPDGDAAAALLPQVYLHYDPYLRPDPERRPDVVWRQRMDFLLLLPGRRRVVIEVDGRQHYATSDGKASTSRYAQMVREDRRLRLAGYEVYRFGGAEFRDADGGRGTLEEFFSRLIDNPPTGL